MTALDVVGNVCKKIFGSRNERLLKAYRRLADEVEALEEQVKALSPETLKAKTEEFRERIKGGEKASEVLPETFAVLREASRRAQAHRHFPCQLIGGRVLYESRVAEMRTGEGKTIVCHLAAYLKACEYKKVNIVTVNDYLVRRDAEFARPIFDLLGLTVGYIQAGVDPGGHEGVRKREYACDVTYGTNSEFGFDYLRDNMKIRRQDQAQGPLDFAIIDEVDSILIDEARTPLIISGPAEDDVTRYKWADNIARFLVRKQASADNETAKRLRAWGDNPPEGAANNPKFEEAAKRFRLDPSMLSEDEGEAIGHVQHFIVQRDRKSAHLTHDGVAAAQEEAGIGSFYIGSNMDRPHLIENALRANIVYERDKEYVVQDREVIIVDEFTGRLMYGRQWSDGLHQAVEAKENVPIKEESQTLATITIQNFFKLYDEIAGMTGTAMTEADEFMKIYRLEVVEIPTNRPVNRLEHNDKIYRDVKEKYDFIVEEIHEVHRRGRPADPFLLADVLKALKPIMAESNGGTDRIDAALRQFKDADAPDKKTIQIMFEAYDEAMGDLAKGRPVLVGTTSVENSEKLAEQLSRTFGIEHEVLNAKQHAREADIVTQAGCRRTPERGQDRSPLGNVTIATNMAGRGTDIKLEKGVVHEKCIGDLAPREPGVISTKCCIYCEDYDPATDCAHCFKPKLDPRFPAMGRTVCKLNAPCGLHIVGTERHEARRIDNQLRGRCGRQGDPGSSRFFLSLEDDLLKLFMPDWMLKMMERLGFVEGVSLEDKRLSKGIERAQKKVEERNFSTRKHLLEWDEPMDYQRKGFYSQRQHILTDRSLSGLIWQLIDDSIAAAVDRYLDEGYGPQCISDWCRAKLDLQIEASKLDAEDVTFIEKRIREDAKYEARQALQTSLGEYVDPAESRETWDISGLARWAQRSYQVSVTQNQLKKMAPDEIQGLLLEGAEKFYDEVDLAPLERYLDPAYPRAALADWARATFAIDIKTDELTDERRDEVLTLLHERIEQAYHRREVEYPVEVLLERAFGHGNTDSAYASQLVVGWANRKFDLNWTIDDVQEKGVKTIYDELVALNRAYMFDGRLEQEIDNAISAKRNGQLVDWAKNRFGRMFDEDAFAPDEDSQREQLVRAGRELLRVELTELERYVLLRIYDQAWKDHLREMDHLKHAIMQRPLGGDQTHPQSQYAIEGREYFDQMWGQIRERVTQTIFKVRMSEDSGASSVYQTIHTRHDEATNLGFAGASADQTAAMRAQGEAGAVVETIKREMPKVGRNQPCPCGSGKKYKHCHGKGK